MKKIFISVVSLILAMNANVDAQKTVPLYQNPKATVEERVNDLLSRMTLAEKIGQMNQFVGIEHIKTAEANLTAEQLKTILQALLSRIFDH